MKQPYNRDFGYGYWDMDGFDKLSNFFNKLKKPFQKQGPVDPAAAASMGAADVGATAAGTTGTAEAAANPGFWATLKNSAPMQFMTQHPYQTAGLGILGGANVAGLVDNDKFGGQLAGAALGGLGSAALHGLAGVSGVNLAWAPLVGGTLGALFDKSREVQDKRMAATERMYPGIQDAAERYMQAVRGMTVDQVYQYDLEHPNETAAFWRLMN